MYWLRSVLAGLLVAVCLVGFVPDAQAQSRTLTIRDGEVYIDGQRIPAEQLPPSLDVSGLNAQYSFSGIARPVVELDGALYAIGDSLRPVPADEVQSQGSLVFFRDSFRNRQNRQMSPSQQGLQEASSLKRAQEQSARHQYLEAIQRQSEQLYNRLMREHQMERETHELAQRIRLLSEGPERQRKLDSLRATLNDIFDLKQENRRREIEQLKTQLAKLQDNLEKRENMREQMIDQRMQELIQEPGSQR